MNDGGGTKSVHIQLPPPNDDSKINEKMSIKSQVKSRSISCQTIFREQSAQTKPYLPPIQYRPGIEKTELFQIDNNLDIDSAPGLTEIKAINRRRKRRECEQVLNQCDSATMADERRNIFETLEWEEWLNRENDIENTQSVRFHTVEEILKQRDKLFEIDSIKAIDQSVNRLNAEHKRKIENIR